MKGQEKSPVEREDLYEFRFVSEASLSPDGTMAVCVVNQASKEDNTYLSGFYLLPAGTKKTMTRKKKSRKPDIMRSVFMAAKRPLL